MVERLYSAEFFGRILLIAVLALSKQRNLRRKC